MIMEQIPCSLNSTKPNAYDVPNFILQVYNGIVAIHDKDFTYQNLKLENILIGVSNNRLTPKIANFRELKLKALGNMTTITGLLLYIAPKLYTINLPYSKAINIQSFRLIVLKLLINWEPNLEIQGFYGLLSPKQYNNQVYNMIFIYIASALETFKSILKGLLCKELK